MSGYLDHRTVVEVATINVPHLAKYQHFMVDQSIWKFAWELLDDADDDARTESLMVFDDWEQEIDEPAFVKAPTSSRLPAKRMTVCLNLPKAKVPVHFYVLEQEGDIVTVRAHDFHSLRPIGQYEPSGPVGFLTPSAVRLAEDGVDSEHWPADVLAQSQNDQSMTMALAFVVSLINEPRGVRLEPSVNRAARRAAHRGMGIAVDAWHQVTWDLSQETVAKISRDPTFHKVPLHYRRGHYRRAEEHYRGAIKRPDAFRTEDRETWWQWIAGQWVGHPAFGIKRSVHAPKLSSGKLAGRKSGLKMPAPEVAQ